MSDKLDIFVSDPVVQSSWCHIRIDIAIEPTEKIECGAVGLPAVV